MLISASIYLWYDNVVIQFFSLSKTTFAGTKRVVSYVASS